MNIEVYCDEENLVPFKATHGAIGYDIFSPQDFELRHGEGIMIDTSLILTSDHSEVEWGYLIFPRSSSCKNFLSLINTAAVIEPEYQGPNDSIRLALKFEDLDVEEGGFLGKDVVNSDLGRYVRVQKGDRIAQIVFIPVLKPTLVFKGTRDQHPGGKSRGGFGSTGK